MKAYFDKHLTLAATAVGALLFALVTSTSMAGSAAKKADMDIVDTAVAAGSFNTLVTALQEADLVSTLKGKGPFTVFAPTDEAFAKIPPEQLQALLKDKAALQRVLTYHVLPQKVTSQQIVTDEIRYAKTVQGQSVNIDVGSGVKIDNANVVKADIMASNGVIHVIDTVILPN
jgi:uncharacterized surface protein with fasciclin (FAS1) repeats